MRRSLRTSTGRLSTDARYNYNTTSIETSLLSNFTMDCELTSAKNASHPPGEPPSTSPGKPLGKGATPTLARDLNKNLMRTLLDGLLEDPEADLMALIPESYRSKMATRKFRPVKRNRSRAADLNRNTVIAILATLESDPKSNVIEVFSPAYSGQRKRMLDGAQGAKKAPKILKSEPHFAHDLEPDDNDDTTSLEVVFPLSLAVSDLLQKAHPPETPDSPVTTLKRLICGSECIWQSGLGSFVARLENNIAVKVQSRSQVNHYLVLEYLAQHAPDVPAPRPHGLIKLADLNVMFMSYVPRCTLTQAWGDMSTEDKVSIQDQLNKIFLNIRSLPRYDRPLGTLDGHGVTDVRGHATEFESNKIIHTISEFEDFVFSPQPCITSTYIRFLRDLVPATAHNQECVFTHCDFLPQNIMVDTDGTGGWIITGIIDWDDAGFYPVYWESVKSMRTVLANAKTDWYLYQPECMAPSTYADKWLLDIVWNNLREKVAPLVLRAKQLGQTASNLVVDQK